MLFYLVAIGACLFVYRDIADNYLYNDDFHWMRLARHDMRWSNILTFQVTGFFRPLINVVFFVTERVMPGNLRAYYLTNLLLHLLNGVVLFHLLSRLTGRRMLAAGSALLFLITSTHWAAVAWISARTALISTGLLLVSMLIVVDRPPARWRRWCAVTLYLLALTAKEDAVVGFLLVSLIVVARGRSASTLPDRRTLVYYGAATLAYLVARTAIIGHVTQPNWGPGPHALRNLAGGFLYGVYPWALASLTGVGRTLEPSTHAVWPEIVAVPVLVILLVAGRLTRRNREVRIGLAWMLIALLPMCMFRFRFFTTDWLTHDRYYYLSSIGACLCVVSLMDGLWSVARWTRFARVVVLVSAIVIIAGEAAAVADRAGRFHRMTSRYAMVVKLVGNCMDRRSTYYTCALEGWPLQKPFMHYVFALERPEWRVVAVDSEAAASAYRPCLYVRLIHKDNRPGTYCAVLE